ncbi:SRPBCC family protein [Streptococcus mutans]|uniref:SRPBCC family protein n=1 Tax=Streptococcus mutans TaxID=1309 RepID=UPI0027419672|nr:hypothetical protein [Streptococcus mutans]MDP5872502.1 hypothetical protein [Streptococcus mutans]
MTEFKVPCDSEAIVFAKSSIIINSNSDYVMKILSDIKKWPHWRSEISKIELLDSSVNEGSDFKWRSGGLGYNSNIHTLSRTHFGWTGRTIGAYAVHNWFIERLSPTQSKVVVQESLNGWSIWLLKKSMKTNLPKLLSKDLRELKHACEHSIMD